MPNLSRPLKRSGRSSLIFVFALAAALVVATMAVVFRVGRVSLESQQRMADQLAILNQLHNFSATLDDAETGQRGFLLTGEEDYLEPYNRAVARLPGELAVLQKDAANGVIATEDLESLTNALHEKLTELDRTIRLRRESGLAAALKEVLTDRGKNYMDEIREVIARLANAAQTAYSDAVQRTKSTETFRTAAFVSAAIVNLLFLAWAFRRLSLQDWLQFGRAQLSQKLAGDQQVSELSENAVRFLAEYLGASVGAMYVENGAGFQRQAAYAVPKADALPERIVPGQGLVGQAVKDGRVFALDDVPEGYLAIGSALGQKRPRRLIVAPMKADGLTNAVVELGFFSAGYNGDVTLLENVGELVAVAVRSAKYRARLQDLLEETQRQAEELQSQTEELRVSNEELEEQSRALKESQARLEQQQIELEQTNSQLEEQTQILESQKEDLMRTKSEMQRQAALVEQASRYKSDFLANMSHELRTPLNSSLILAKLLADNRTGNLTEEQIKFARTIQSAGNDLLALINDVLDLAKVEAGRMDLKPETVPIAHLLDGLKGSFAPMAQSKGLALRFQTAPRAPDTIETDRRRLEQVLKNLIANAVKFTERGEVAVEVSAAAGERVAFAVRDTGIGIADDQRQIIFEPFCQADATASRKYGGTGLGLSISRELARLLGGEIKLASVLGRGSVFTVILPRVYRESDLIARPSSSEPLPPAARMEAPAARERRPAPPRKAHIADDRERLTGSGRVMLIVEDDTSFATILVDLGHEMKFQCLVADTAEEALALAAQFLPSAILLDIGLPDNSGMLVLERLKADARTRHIPVHVVSGADYSQTALSLGAVGYMLKPVQREQLIEAFQKLETRLTQKLRRVLVVEDDPTQLEALRQLLGSQQVDAVGVRTAAECLDKLRAATFDCMVLDLSLPDASGFTLLETLSAEETYSFPPVIVYTGRELTPDQEQQLRKYSKSIIIKGAKSPERLLDEVTLFLHQVVSELPQAQQKMLEKARSRDAALEGKRILIAEDDVRNIFALTSLLEPNGVKLTVARNGREALQALEQSASDPDKRIDLVLMDIMMPEMNGLAATREIRKNPEWKRLPIIALTAKAMKDDQEKCLQAGADDYLAKPLDVEKLLSLIRVWMPR